MAARRSGQITREGDGHYRVRVYLGEDQAGKRRYKSKTIRGTIKDAERYLQEALHKAEMGVDPKGDKMKFGDFLDLWLETEKAPRVTQCTYRDYQYIVNHYIKPTLGGRALGKVTLADIQNLLKGMQQKGITRKTNYTRVVLRNALSCAVKYGYILHNPAQYVAPLPVKKNEMKVLDKREAAAFLEAAGDDMYGVLFAVMLTTGLRPSEALGLKWGDLQSGTLRIQRSIERNGNGWNFGSLKTPKARRSVSVPSSLLIRLKAHRVKQVEQKLSGGADYQDHGLIFATPEGQPLDLANIRQRHFKPILQKAGLHGIRMYDLRHTCATLLLAAGENVKVVSERLGHASVAMTLDNYAHVLPDMQQQATDKLEDMLYGA